MTTFLVDTQLPVRVTDDGKHVVKLDDIAAALGYNGAEGAVSEIAGRAAVKLPLIVTTDGPVLEHAHAEQVLTKLRAWLEGYYAEQEAYREYLAERRRQAAEEREAAAREEMQQRREAARRRSEHWTATQQQQAQAEIAAQQAARAARDGNPLPFDKWRKSNGR